MRQNDKLQIKFLLGLLFILLFVNVPYLGDVHKAGKSYVLLFGVYFISLFFLWSKKQISFSKLHLLLLLICSILAANLFFSYHLFTASQSLLSFFALSLLSVIVTNLASLNSNIQEQLCDLLITAGIISSLMGLFEYLRFIWLGPSRNMLIPYLLPPDTHTRVGGIFGQPNLFALLLLLTLLAIFYRYIHFPNKLVNNKSIRKVRFLLPLLTGLVFFLTFSRAGLLAFVIIFCFIIWRSVSGRYLIDDKIGRRELTSLCICLAIAFLFAKIMPIVLVEASSSEGYRAMGSELGHSIEKRYVYVTSAVLIFLDHPLTGVGLDNFKLLLSGYELQAHSLLGFVEYEAMVFTNWAHNELVQLLCEGGILVFLLVLIALSIYAWQVWKKYIRNKSDGSFRGFYAHLFLLPFIVQGMFSWPFRYPPLVALFFVFLGLLLAEYPTKFVAISRSVKYGLSGIIICVFCVTAVGFSQELKIGDIRLSLADKAPIQEVYAKFEKLAEHPYSSYRVKRAVIPYLIKDEYFDDKQRAEELLEYALDIVELQGTSIQWYNLGLIYLKLHNEVEAKAAAQKALDLQPINDNAWGLLHYINVLKASRETGRSIESFYPDVPEEMMMDFFND